MKDRYPPLELPYDLRETWRTLGESYERQHNAAAYIPQEQALTEAWRR